MKKPYMVEIVMRVAVVAVDEDDALTVARNSWSDMRFEEYDVECLGEIRDESDLRYGWTKNSLPYGIKEDVVIEDIWQGKGYRKTLGVMGDANQ
jgi:hypothetical protein